MKYIIKQRVKRHVTEILDYIYEIDTIDGRKAICLIKDDIKYNSNHHFKEELELNREIIDELREDKLRIVKSNDTQIKLEL
jgi:UTP-glucose-1-phosphate uridylyltransferase